MLGLFLLTATQPYSLLFGPLIIGPYRLALMLMALPLLAGWIGGRYGRFVVPDFLMLGYVLWVGVALAGNGQASRVPEYAGGEFIDTFVAYLLGRAAIRSKEDLYFFARFFLIMLLFLLPFAILESTRGLMILQDLFRNVPGIKPFNPINHPIVYGVFCSIGFSFGWLALRHAGKGLSLFQRLLFVAGSAGGTVFSFSAGALAGLMTQIWLMLWNWLMAKNKNRWKILGGIVGTLYVVLDIVASKPPLVVMARAVAFSGSTSWNRYQIWVFGSAEVARHPIFGKGLFTDWVRQPWMSPSIDNYWLLVAMRFGVPGIGMLIAAYLYICIRLIRMNFSPDPAMAAIRYSYVFVFAGLFISMATVSVWHITYSLIIMLIGGAVWVFNEPPAGSFVPKSSRALPSAGAAGAMGRTAGAGQPGRARSGAAPSPATAETAKKAGDNSAAKAARGRFTRFTRFPDGPGGSGLSG
jgi:MFS family permease